MDSGYSPDLYVERTIDETLRQQAICWLRPSARLRWVSLSSRPGRGNSWMFKHFRHWIVESDARFDGMKVIFVSGLPAQYPASAGPLVAEIARLNREGQRSPVQRALRRVRRAPTRRKVAALFVLFVFLIPACLWAGLSEFNKSPEAHWESVGLWVEGFTAFSRANWYKFPFWLITDSLLGFILTSGLGALTLYLSRGSLFPDKDLRDDVKQEDLDELKTDEKLGEALSEIGRNSRGVILLVDDAQWLPDDERRLLVDLCAPPPQRPELARFVERHRVLIMTLESQDVNWGDRPEEEVFVFEVPDFTPETVGRIAWTQLGDELARLEEAEREKLLSEGQEDINNLFAGRAAAFDEEVGKLFEEARKGGFPDGFDRKDLMVFWAVSHRPSVSRSEMRDKLAALEAVGHLKDFGLSLSANPQLLVNEFPLTTLAHQGDQTYHFDVSRCQALQRVLANGSLHPRGGDPHEALHLLARAHYGWFRLLAAKLPARTVGPASLWPEEQRQALREAAWHIFKIGNYLERPTDVLAEAAGLEDAVRRERRYEVVDRLLDAADVYRSGGNTTESNDLVMDAVEWLPAENAPQRSEWLERGAGQLWSNFWLAGGRARVRHLRDLLRCWPGLRATQTWRANRRFEKLLRCRRSLGVAPRESSLPAELLNLHRLTRMLNDIRSSHGLTEPALKDTSLKVRAPSDAPTRTLHEMHLRQLHAAAWIARGDAARLATSLAAWRERLADGVMLRGQLGDEVVHCYGTARYWHTLADLCRVGLARISEDEDIPVAAEEGERLRLFETVRGFCLTPPPEGMPLPDFLWQEAQASYERVRQLATFLYWRPLLMEACFQEGELLREHTPEGRRLKVDGAKPWWWRWDKLFWQAINLEREAGWLINTPVMHRNRWEFFSAKEDNERNVEDAYNALQTIRQAGYPLPLILDWHQQVRAHLINHSDSDEDRRRDAELNEEWVDRLAALPEARAHWRFDCFELEQASALHFAAQARRLIQEPDLADLLLDRADALVEASAAPAPAPALPGPNSNGEQAEGHDGNGNSRGPAQRKMLRDLKISLKIQRAWLRQAQERIDDYRRAIYEVWRDIDVNDEDCAIVLGCLADIEHQEKVLGDPWPAPGAPPHEDPDSPGMSLPEEWFAGPFPLRLKNRYEFRLYQLLNTVNYMEWLERLSRGAELAQLPTVLGLLHNVLSGALSRPTHDVSTAGPGTLFSSEVLKTVARLHWLGVGRLAEISHAFAAYGLIHSHTAETRAIIVNLLDAARLYFAEVERVDSDELETLRLLIEYEPNSPRNYRLEYARVLIQHKHLLEHEKLSLEAAKTTDWYAVAKRIHKYLHVLVDDELLGSGARLELQTRGLSEQDFYNQRGLRREAMKAAFAKHEAGDLAACLAMLGPALPHDASPWVFIEDLQVLHLWLECAKQSGAASADVAHHEAALRTLARRYIRQFKVVVRDEEVRQLVSGILSGLHDTG